MFAVLKIAQWKRKLRSHLIPPFCMCVCVCGCDCLLWGSTISCHYLFRGTFEKNIFLKSKRWLQTGEKTRILSKSKNRSSADFGSQVSLDPMAASMKMAPHISLVGEWVNQVQNWDKLCWKGERRMFERIFLRLSMDERKSFCSLRWLL